MSLSNNPLQPSAPLQKLEPQTRLESRSEMGSERVIESPTDRTEPLSKPESFKARGSSSPLTTDQKTELEQLVAKTPGPELVKRSHLVPKPPAMTQRVSVFSESLSMSSPSQTTQLSQQDFAQHLIRPNFAQLCKALDRSVFSKQKVLDKAQERGQLIAQMTPPGSDLMRTFASASDQQLRELVSAGIALTKPNKYGPETHYDGLSRNKQKMVDAIVSGLKQGLPPEIQRLRSIENRGDVKAIQTRLDLQTQIRDIKIKAPSQQTLEALEKYVDSKGIDLFRAKLKEDSDSLRTALSYRDLPVPDPAETSLDVLGNEELKALLPLDDGLSSRVLEALAKIPEEERKGLLWTLGMKPFNQTCEDVSKRVFDQSFSELDDLQTEAVKALSQQLVVSSLAKLGPESGNSLLNSDTTGPKEITYEGKPYDRVSQLGEGGFGVAYLFKERDGEDELVVKRFKSEHKTDEEWFAGIQDEIRTHRYAMGSDGKGHDNVLNIKGIITRPPNTLENELFGEVFTVTDVAKGGELRDVMKTLHQQLLAGRISKTVSDLLNRQIFAQTVEGMHYIQKDRQMLHLDLKPENLLMTESGTVKVGDFGLAHIGHQTEPTTGTKVYLSPEIVSGGQVDFKSDTWTLGIIGRELFTGTRALPDGSVIPKKDAQGFRPMVLLGEFGSDTDNRIYQSGQEEGSTPTLFEGSDGVERPLQNLSSFHQLINAMQHPDPAQRPTLDAVRRHEFVSDPILSSEPVQQLLALVCQSESRLSPEQVKARKEDIVRLNSEIEALLKR